MYFVYVLRSITAKKTYVGMTNDLGRRLAEHNAGKHVYTKRHVPWEVFHHESFENRIKAHAHEKYLKSAAGRRFLKKLFAS